MTRLLTIIFGLLTFFMLSGTVAAQSSGEGAQAVSRLQLLPNCLSTNPQTAGIGCVSETITHFTSLLLWAIAFGAFIYILYGAFLYTSAFGDEGKIKTAKNVMKYALIGVIIATLANVMVQWLQTVLQVPSI